MLLAIETSCDESAVAIMDTAKAFASSGNPARDLLLDMVASQTKLHGEYGGVVPELAAREHIANLPVLTQELLSRVNISPGWAMPDTATTGFSVAGYPACYRGRSKRLRPRAA